MATDVRQGDISTSRSRRLSKHALLIIFGVVMLYPLLWMVSSSIKPNEIIFRDPSIWPTELDLGNYVRGWSALSHPSTTTCGTRR